MNAAVDAAVNEVRSAYPEGLAEALVAVADAEGISSRVSLRSAASSWRQHGEQDDRRPHKSAAGEVRPKKGNPDSGSPDENIQPFRREKIQPFRRGASLRTGKDQVSRPGTFQKGQSGNPGGRPKEIAEVKALARSLR